MRIFSKIVFICNLCFIAAMVLRWWSLLKKAAGDFTEVLPLRPIESTIVILGYAAVLLNLLYFFRWIYARLSKGILTEPRWVRIFNLSVLPLQLYYFFFSA